MPVHGNPSPLSGDATVPYFSLSWCKQWLGPRVNITRSPQSAYESRLVQKVGEVEHVVGAGGGYEDLYPSQMTRAAGERYITFYEDSGGVEGRRTAVWELDKGGWRRG